jgi:hypothetical protein
MGPSGAGTFVDAKLGLVRTALLAHRLIESVNPSHPMQAKHLS